MPAVVNEIVTLTGEVTSWRAVRGGWGFGQLRTARDDVPFTGTVLARVGDTVEVRGVWVEHDRYGRQLKVKSCTVARPESSAGIVAWLVSTLPNIGSTRARALVERFGSELWSVIEQRPEALTEVDGITDVRVEAIVSAYHAHRLERDHMVRLRGWGLSDAQVARCREAWGSLEAVVDHVHANPYELAECVPGFGFLRADRVARLSGVPSTAPARIFAGVVYVLETAVSAGDCFLWGAELQRRTAKLLDVPPAIVADGIRATCASGHVIGFRARYYVRRIDEAESACASSFATMIDRKAADL